MKQEYDFDRRDVFLKHIDNMNDHPMKRPWSLLWYWPGYRFDWDVYTGLLYLPLTGYETRLVGKEEWFDDNVA